MKNLYFTVILTVVLFSGCTAASKTLVEVGGTASCVEYEIQDENGNKIEVPKDVEEALVCFSGSIKLSPDQNFLAYSYGNSLKFYNFAKNSTQNLLSLDEDLEGIGCVWDSLGEKIACALVNQQKYVGGTKYVVIDLDDDTKEYLITAETMADFVCGASCYPGEFWFEDENTLKYEGHNIVAPGEVFEIQLQ